MLTVGASHGLGVHQSEVSDDEVKNVELYAFLNHFLALIANGLGKVAIVVFILQWQGYQNRLTIAFLWFIAASGLIINVVNAVLLLVQCSPASSWNCGTSHGGIILGLVLGCKHCT